MQSNWNLAAPPGFQGLRDDLQLSHYARNLPHWRQPGATYFVTFRLVDSLPQPRLRELDHMRQGWARKRGTERMAEKLEQFSMIQFETVEFWLDQGAGCCVLAEARWSELVDNSMQHFHGERYELGASVVMPNHVHCVIRPQLSWNQDLEDLIGSWKAFTARRINAGLGQSGALWQEESYDQIIRHEGHLWNVIQYIGRNPSQAQLSNESCRLWINPEWKRLGWDFLPGP
jgi:putative transposase